MLVRHRIRKNKRGFTLVELMTVVAIIGVLATVGVPQYRKIQRKAKRAEATLGLGVIASGEAGFYAEYNGYGDNLGGLGVELQTAPLSYNIGFLPSDCVGRTSSFDWCETGAASCTSGGNPGAFPGYQSAKIQMLDNNATFTMTSSASSFFRAYVRSGAGTTSGFVLSNSSVNCPANGTVLSTFVKVSTSVNGGVPTFAAAAVGNLYNRSDNTLTADVISIDNQRVIQIKQDGT